MFSWNFRKSYCDEFYETYRSGHAGEHVYKCVSFLSCLATAVCVCVGVLQDGSANVFLTAGANTDVFV